MQTRQEARRIPGAVYGSLLSGATASDVVEAIETQRDVNLPASVWEQIHAVTPSRNSNVWDDGVGRLGSYGEFTQSGSRWLSGIQSASL